MACLLATIACGGSGGSSNPSPTTPTTGGTTTSATTFQGTIAGSGGQSGTIAVTISTAVSASSLSPIRGQGSPITLPSISQPLSVASNSGTLILAGGGTIPLTGTFDSSTKTVALSGGGFGFIGSVSGAVLSGTYTGPSGSSGGFSSLNSTQTSVTTYCGTYQSGNGSGVLNIAISAAGAVSGASSDGCLLAGQLSGTALTLSCNGGSSATGTVQNGAVSGTTASGGTFNGSSGGCTAPTPPAPAPTPAPATTVTPGNWSFELGFNVFLNATPDKGCTALASGTTVVSSSGAFSIPYSVACEKCTMTGTVAGTIVPGAVSGSATGTLSGPIAGAGACSIQQPTPGALSGGCTSAGCIGGTSSDGSQVALSFVLTPP